MNIFPRFKRQIFSALMSSYTLLMFGCNLFVPAYADKINIEEAQTVNNGENVSVTDSIYDALVSSDGSINALSNNGTITRISNSEFLNNSYKTSSNIMSGSGIYNSGLIESIDESNFSNNNIAIINYSDITLIDNSTFIENNTGIYVDGKNADLSSVSNSTFINNTEGITLKETGKEGNRAHLGTISNSTFENNSIGVQNLGSDIDSIKGSFFISNDTGVIANTSYSGGYIGLIDDTEFISNDIGVSVSGSRVDTISNSLFENNNTGIYISGRNPGGSSSYLFSSIGTIENTSFVNNRNNITSPYDEAYSAAIYNANGSIDKIVSSTFTNNTLNIEGAREYASGGAVYNGGQIGTVEAEFNNNGVQVSNYYAMASGGAIKNDYDGKIDNISSNFGENFAHAQGSYYAVAAGGAIQNESGHIGNIKGDFTGNYAYAHSGEQSKAAGGAISQTMAEKTIVNIEGNFDGNYAVADSTAVVPELLITPSDNYYNSIAYAYGGAVDNDSSVIWSINSIFSNNYTEAVSNYYAESLGGAIASRDSDSLIDNLDGEFINNTSSASGNMNAFAGGGAIYNEGLISSINAEFNNNSAFSSGTNSNAYGGAILNSGITGAVTADFIGNHVKAEGENAVAYGGAVYNESYIVPSIQNEGLTAEVQVLKINMNDGTTKILSTAPDLPASVLKVFIDNNLIEGISSNETVMTENEINEMIAQGDTPFDDIDGLILYMKENGAIEGDLGQYYTDNSDKNIPPTSMVFTNSSFINNYAESEGSAKGGAIYSTHNIKIQAKDGYKSLISGNYTISNGVKDDNAIYMANSTKEAYSYDDATQTETYSYKVQPSSLILESKTNGIIQVDDKISGDKGGYEIEEVINYETGEMTENILNEENNESYKIYITGDNTGTVILNNDVEGEADMYLYQTTLKLGKRDDVLKNNNMTFNSGTFDMVNNNIGSTNFNTLTLNDNIKTKADVDLINETMDRITSDNYIINENKLNDKLISVDYLNLLNDSTKDSVKILYADEEISSNVEYTGSNPIQVSKDKIAYSPIYKYTVSYDIDENDNMGYFTFNRGNINDSDSYNPSVLAPSVSSQAGAYTTQLQTLEYAFKHSDAFMALPSFERMAIINADRYALTPTSDATDIGTFSPLMTKLDVSGFWVKPYTSFESIPLNNGPKVSNISYGTLVGYDSNLKHLKNGWERVLTGYIGYNGASQRYSGIDTYQNGGILGLTTTFYKNNFFNATTISTGATVGNSSTYYGDEDYTMLTAGIGNKFGYNFEFKDGKFILQPNLLLSYTFINTFDYTNAAGLKIKSDPLHALQIAPGIKFIMNTESGWQPYLRADMIWNILDKTKVTANDVRLPEMSIDPYVQYGIGVQKLFKNERLTFFGQALVQNGGRNGVSLNAGLRWAIGKGTN